MHHIALRLLVLSLVIISCAGQATEPTHDLLITNATIIDGSGGEPFQGSILIQDGIIVEVGEVNVNRDSVIDVIDAEGKVVSPGFIDTHSHGNPLDTPRFDNFLSMGVTTISLGQDGRSPGLDDVDAWMNEVDEQGTGPNVIYFVGHSTLRQQVDALRQSGLPQSYIDEMQDILRNAMKTGAFGMTTGIEYDHGTFADMQELLALGEPIAEAGGLIMSHMRSEDDDKIEDSVTELLDQGRGSGAKVHASHIKIVFGDDPQQAEDVLGLMDEARNEGVSITADVYPYTASFTGIAIVFPEWALPPNDFEEVVENRRDELEEYLRNRVEMRNGPEATLFGTEPWAGMTLAEVADEFGKPFEKVLIDDIGPRGASAAYFVMNEDVMQRFLVDPYVMVSTDGGPEMRHPRGYGSFAKIIRKYVNELDLFSIEEAIYKMSGLPAETLGLTDRSKVDVQRGLIREGFVADLLIFDPENILDTADFENPHSFAEGFDWVFVDGQAVIDNGQRNDLLPAGVIRKKVPL